MVAHKQKSPVRKKKQAKKSQKKSEILPKVGYTIGESRVVVRALLYLNPAVLVPLAGTIPAGIVAVALASIPLAQTDPGYATHAKLCEKLFKHVKECKKIKEKSNGNTNRNGSTRGNKSVRKKS